MRSRWLKRAISQQSRAGTSVGTWPIADYDWETLIIIIIIIIIIEADVWKLILVSEPLTRSTRFTHFWTAPNSKIQLNVVEHFHILAILVSTCHSFFEIVFQFAHNFDEKSLDVQQFLRKTSKSSRFSNLLRFRKDFKRVILTFRIFRQVTQKFEKS